MSVEHVKLLLREDVFQPYSHKDEECDEEGKRHRCLLDRLQGVEDDQAEELDRGEEVEPAVPKPRHVGELRVLGGVEDPPQENPVKELVPGNGGDAHVQEHAEEDALRYVSQVLGQEEGEPDEHVDAQVRPPLLDDLAGHLLHAASWQAPLLVGREGDEVGDGAHRGRARERQAHDAAHGEDDQSADEEVQVVPDGLLYPARGAVDEQGREVLVQVEEHGHAEPRHEGGKDSPRWQRFLHTKGVDEPGPRIARVLVLQSGDDLVRHREPLDVDIAPDLRHGRGDCDRKADGKVRNGEADKLVGPRRLL
mmetsp:Transcript_46245/g.143101  ORF Transcript_46245/g.143101 Transcript_46245/m.143101 type:complete len:308 (-) Transcript_46245:820-1743(-)